MPLDERKIAHIQAVLPKTWAGRERTVVFVYNASGVYSFLAQTGIFRQRRVPDPQIPGSNGTAPGLVRDALLIVPLTTNLTGVVYIADTSTASSGAVAAAPKYEIVERVPTGMVPPGTRYVLSLRRMR